MAARTPSLVRAWTDDAGTVHLIADRVRPDQAAKVIGHEIIGHHGLRAVFGDQFDTFLDEVYTLHRSEIDRYTGRYKADPESEEGRRYLTEEFLADCADAKKKPSWWKEFLARCRAFLDRVLGKHHFSDLDIEAALSRSARAVRKKNAGQADLQGVMGKNEGVRFAVDGKYFQSWQEVLAKFKKDLEGAALTPEQQQIYNAVTTPGETARIRIDDLNELEDVFLHYGTRKKGGRKIISVHYAGLRNPVTALEVVNIGDVIRRGKLVENGTPDHPLSRCYELTADDGANLRVVLDYWRTGEKNRSVINLYSNRKPGAHNVSSRRLTDQEYNIPSSGENSSPGTGKIEENTGNGAGNTENTKNTGNTAGGTGGTGRTGGMRFSVAPVYTGSAADYDRPSLHFIGTGEGAQVYGWGLYGSSNEDVARWYAENDAERKGIR